MWVSEQVIGHTGAMLLSSDDDLRRKPMAVGPGNRVVGKNGGRPF